jgi:hypothetical protein
MEGYEQFHDAGKPNWELCILGPTAGSKPSRRFVLNSLERLTARVRGPYRVSLIFPAGGSMINDAISAFASDHRLSQRMIVLDPHMPRSVDRRAAELVVHAAALAIFHRGDEGREWSLVIEYAKRFGTDVRLIKLPDEPSPLHQFDRT